MRKDNQARLLGAIALTALVSSQLFGTLPAEATAAAGLRAPASFLSNQKPLTGPIDRYVAMGDSYAAGPLIPSTRSSNCIRSTNNYATWLAYNRGLVGWSGWMNDQFQDVSCSSATTDAASNRAVFNQASLLPVDEAPELDAVTANTNLITITMGGNDEGLFDSLVSQCPAVKDRAPEGSPCRDFFRTKDGHDQWEGTLARTQDRLSDVLAAIRLKAAPGARILVVGYGLRLPDDGTVCSAVDIAKGDYSYLNEQSFKLNRALAAAARAQQVGFVDTYTATAGHTACDPNPFIQGSSTNIFSAVSNHPTKAAMVSTADLIDQVLRGNAAASPSQPIPILTGTLGQPVSSSQAEVNEQLADRLNNSTAENSSLLPK